MKGQVMPTWVLLSLAFTVVVVVAILVLCISQGRAIKDFESKTNSVYDAKWEKVPQKPESMRVVIPGYDTIDLVEDGTPFVLSADGLDEIDLKIVSDYGWSVNSAEGQAFIAVVPARYINHAHLRSALLSAINWLVTSHRKIVLQRARE